MRNGSGSLARLGRRSPTRDLARPGARQESLREANLLLITEEIFASTEPLSRADLSVRTGMTRSTVSRLVEDLLAAAIVREGSPLIGPSRGRPAVPLMPAPRTLAGLGVEVNVDFMAARVLDLTGSVLAEAMVEGDFRSSDPAEVLGAAGDLAVRVAKEAGATGATVVGTTLALPGLVAEDERSLLLAPNLGWIDVDVVDLLCASAPEGVFGQSVRVANEAKLAALAVAQELTEVDGEEQTFLYVSAQMGIGSAVVINGIVEAGPHGWAGELGHISVEPSGPDCSCGSNGCLEVYAGKHALLEAAGLPASATAEDLIYLVKSGLGHPEQLQTQAEEALSRAGWSLGIALAGAMNVWDVHDVVLGGEFGPLTDLLRPHIEQQLQRRVLAARWVEFRVRESGTGPAPATSGGAMRALRAVLDAPEAWVPTS
ncbi:ROK family transcriptional regulator [Nesterenkonia sphaerica]|uniref:ROK family protein n=1 Tax=Nesterenkonia sphaerica TaxID=1804988 RepID=A0A5R9A4X6_9MICC|nr:ROK family transcriptional regulator [Nesterenkonia sphaerica]TLP72836.1 ROK family protein [Nesterenkonia sphaerica]